MIPQKTKLVPWLIAACVAFYVWNQPAVAGQKVTEFFDKFGQFANALGG